MSNHPGFDMVTDTVNEATRELSATRGVLADEPLPYGDAGSLDAYLSLIELRSQVDALLDTFDGNRSPLVTT